MTDVEKRRYEMLIRVRDFGAIHGADFDPASLGAQIFAEVNTTVDELEHQTTVQSLGEGGVRVGSASKALARAALHDDLQAISATARVIAIYTPGLENKFRRPRGGTDQALLIAARAFAEDAAPLAAEFIRHEMPPDFLDTLKKNIDAFAAAVTDRNRGKDTRVKATASVDSAIERSITAVHRLNAIVRNKYRNDSPTLLAWESASHVERNNPRAAVPPKTDNPTPGTQKPGP